MMVQWKIWRIRSDCGHRGVFGGPGGVGFGVYRRNNRKAMVSSMDHKRAQDGDLGLNTGGMGTVAPNPITHRRQPAVHGRDFPADHPGHGG